MPQKPRVDTKSSERPRDCLPAILQITALRVNGDQPWPEYQIGTTPIFITREQLGRSGTRLAVLQYHSYCLPESEEMAPTNWGATAYESIAALQQGGIAPTLPKETRWNCEKMF